MFNLPLPMKYPNREYPACKIPSAAPMAAQCCFDGGMAKNLNRQRPAFAKSLAFGLPGICSASD